jgi:hypothetical protein
MSTCGVGTETMEQHRTHCSHSVLTCDYQERGLAYRGSALTHPDSTPEFINRTLKRRAKNKAAKQSRKKNR